MLGVRSAYRAGQIDRSSDFLISLLVSGNPDVQGSRGNRRDVQESDLKSRYAAKTYDPLRCDVFQARG
jgi:hypothetical protein